MKRNFFVGLCGGLIGSAMLLILLSAAGVVGATPDKAAEKIRPEAVSAATALTSTFTYQGQLKNNGSPVNNPACQMAFRLYDDPSTGSVIGSPFTTTVPVTNGLFVVGLNFGSSAFNGDGRWLDIRVNCGGGFVTLTPRQALTPAPYALALPGLYTQWNDYSPNIIGGYRGNVISSTVVGSVIGGGGGIGGFQSVQADFAVIGGGNGNIANGWGSSIGGGACNSTGNTSYIGCMYRALEGDMSTVAGGYQNAASGFATTVSGGKGNYASGTYAAIAGGESNSAGGNDAAVGGGWDNHANAWYTAIGGGQTNIVDSAFSTIGGGIGNTANNNERATIGGGEGNTASGWAATVPGGSSNSATMSYTLAAGRRAEANNQGAFVWADSTDADFASTANDQFLVRANGGVGINTNTPAANTLTVGGSGLRVGIGGTSLKRIQAGQVNVGTGLAGVNVYTITFPSAFTTIPIVYVTPYNDPNFDAGNDNDMFAVTIRRCSTTQLVVNVLRVDSPGGWAQSLRLNWYAGE